MTAEPQSQPAPNLQPLLVDVTGLCRLLSISRRQFFTLRSAHGLPLRQIRLGHKIFFEYREVEAFVRAGCPAAGWSWEGGIQ